VAARRVGGRHARGEYSGGGGGGSVLIVAPLERQGGDGGQRDDVRSAPIHTSPPRIVVGGRCLLRQPLVDDPAERLHRLGTPDRGAFHGIRRRGAPDDEPWRPLHARRRAVGEAALDLGRVPAGRDTLLELRPSHADRARVLGQLRDRKSTRLNSSHSQISYAVFCLKKKTNTISPCILSSNHSI